MSESFAELFEESLGKTQMRPGSIIPGTVVQIDSDFVIVNAGLKSEGVIPLSQFFNSRRLAPTNDTLSILVSLTEV